MAEHDRIEEFDYQGFAARLREAIDPEKPTTFAARNGLEQPTLSKYLRAQGTAPRLDIVARIASGAATSIDWLVYGRSDDDRGASAGLVRVPRFDAQLAAGAGSWNEGRRKIEDIPFTSGFMRERLGRSSAAGLAIVEANGDSMEPTISDGALVLIDEADQRLTDGVFAFVLNGEARVKRFRQIFDGLQIVSDNPVYPVETLSGEQLERLQIVGRVRWTDQVL